MRPLRDIGQLDGSAAPSPDQRGGASPRPCSAGAVIRSARTDPRIGCCADSRIGDSRSDAPFWLEDYRCQPPDKGWGVRSEMDPFYLANQTAALSWSSGSIRRQLTSRFSSVSTLAPSASDRRCADPRPTPHASAGYESSAPMARIHAEASPDSGQASRARPSQTAIRATTAVLLFPPWHISTVAPTNRRPFRRGNFKVSKCMFFLEIHH